MEKAAVAGIHAGSRWEIPLVRCAAVAGAVCIVAPAVWAQDTGRAPGDVIVAEARTDVPMRFEVNTSSLPRIEAQDSGFQAPRVDVSLLPRGTGLGPMLGLSTPGQGLQPNGLNPTRPSVDLGLRYSHRLQSQQRIDVMAWRRMNTDDDAYSLIQQRQPVYGARVELNLAPASGTSRLATGLGFIGLQLESGARISVKNRSGRPMIYYRTTF